MDIRDRINEAAIGKMTKKRKGAKNPVRSAAAKKNWKANRAAIVAGIRKYWKSGEGKAMAAKLGKWRSKNESEIESFEYDVEDFMAVVEEEAPEVVEMIQDYLEEEGLEGLEDLMMIAKELEESEEEEMTFTEAAIKRRKKKRVDPKRSRLMKLVRKKNKASFAKGAKKATRTKKSKGTYKKLGKFNSKRKRNDSVDAVAAARAFLEGSEVSVNEDETKRMQKEMLKAFDNMEEELGFIYDYAEDYGSPGLLKATKEVTKAFRNLQGELDDFRN